MVRKQYAALVMVLVCFVVFSATVIAVCPVDPCLVQLHSGAYTTAWQESCPDMVTYIPVAESDYSGENQHFLVIPLADGTFFAVWTSCLYETDRTHHILCSRSTDKGKTWTTPYELAGPTWNGTNYINMATWAFPIYVESKNRIYVFYVRNYTSPQIAMNWMRCKYSEDNGATWSDEYVVGTYTWDHPDWDSWGWIIWQTPVMLESGQYVGAGTIWLNDTDKPISERGREIWFWRFDNIMTEDDPRRFSITMLPDGDQGIRYPDSEGTEFSTAEEPTVVRLSDGRWFCIFRTSRGYIAYCISSDQGHTWTTPQPLRYRDGGAIIDHPRAPGPLYKMADDNYLLVFYNNDGYANGASGPSDWALNRRPVYYTIGIEMLTAQQPIWFSLPEMLADNSATPIGYHERTEIASYCSYFEYEEMRYFWYPDRKHFLLGKYITDQMVEDKIQPNRFISDAKVYFAFEGEDNGLSSSCWQNWGSAGYGEFASTVGSQSSYPTTTVTGVEGVKGQSFDSRHIANQTGGNTYAWGYKGTTDSDMEMGLKDAWSFTVTGWVKPMPLGDISRLIKVHNVFDLMAWGNGELHLMLAETDHWLLSGTDGILLQSNQWNFFAATYDGTDSSANVKMYIGTETIPVQLTSRVNTKAIGCLDGGTNGAFTVIGNVWESGTRPVTGLMDEVRIWVSQEGSAGVLSLEELEMVRKFDLQIPISCYEVWEFGQQLKGDLDQDCDVDMTDLSIFSGNWLGNNNPAVN